MTMDPTALATALATFMLVVVTALLAIVTRQLAKAADRQTEYLRQQTEIQQETQRRELERNIPKVRIVSLSHSLGHIGIDGTQESRDFEGFTITNAGMVDVTITQAGLAFGVPQSEPNTIRSDPGLQRAAPEWRGFTIPNDPLPAKLKRGDRITVLYDANDLIRIGRAFLPECWDSLGNRYTSSHWVRVDPNRVVFEDGPGEGYRAPTQ